MNEIAGRHNAGTDRVVEMIDSDWETFIEHKVSFSRGCMEAYVCG